MAGKIAPVAQVFKSSFSPYRGRHLINLAGDAPDLFEGGSTWRTVDRPLRDTAIEDAIRGARILGYYLAASPRAFAVDIDDHGGKGSAYLLERLEYVRDRLGAAPSLLVRSPRGLHAHYFLTWPVPAALLEERLRARFDRAFGIEIRPTMNQGLRIPAQDALLDPETTLPLKLSFRDAVDLAERYHPAELLSEEILPEAMRRSLAERKGALLRFRQWDKIARAEADALPILPGLTNGALCSLIPIYRAAGLDEETAALRFRDLLAPVYSGELRSWDRLLGRVRSFYRNTKETPYTRPTGPRSRDLFAGVIADNLAACVPDMKRACQRRDTVRRFTLGILDWKAYIDAIKANPAALAAWNYLYPYFGKNLREGYYPLPRSLLRAIDPNYHRFLPVLTDAGFLEESPYQYVPNAGISKYYKIRSESFLA